MSREQRARPPLIVLGAGPVGLIAALHARQVGLPVEVVTDQLPTAGDPCRLEAIPAQMIALLVEFGVHPRLLGVDRIHARRLTQWRSQEAIVTDAPASAHISRPALEVALINLADRFGVRIRTVGNSAATEISAAVDAGSLILDSTGRSAATAARVARAEVPLVCRTFTQEAGVGPDLDGFAVAAGPEGYAYRLGNAHQVTLGVVGHGGLLRGNAKGVVENIRAFAPWIVEGIDSEQLAPGCAGSASLQWCEVASEGIQPIGDARIARDALASQGLAIGISDALRAVREAAKHAKFDLDPLASHLAHHRKRVGDLIEESPFGSAPHWRRYLGFLYDHAPIIDKRITSTMEVVSTK
jgi:flavin-dependent dehydrogenase